MRAVLFIREMFNIQRSIFDDHLKVEYRSLKIDHFFLWVIGFYLLI